MVSERSVMAVIRAARPSFRNNNDKVAFAVHASFLASGYVLIATGPPAFSDSVLSSSFSASDEDIGIDQWNELDDQYAFLYADPENNRKLVLVKCLVINHKLLVDALAQGNYETFHLEINIRDYAGENYNGSRSYSNLEALVYSLNTQVLCKLDPCASSNTNMASVGTSTTMDPSNNSTFWPSAGTHTANYAGPASVQLAKYFPTFWSGGNGAQRFYPVRSG